MEAPEEVKWLLPIVVGEGWPEGDEDKLRELRDAWPHAAEAILPVVDTGNAATREVLGSWTGESAQAFDAARKKLIEGDQAAFTLLENSCNSLAKACDQTALDVECTKYTIIAALLLLAIQIAAVIAAAFVSFGASSAGIVPAQLATRAAVQRAFRQLVQKLMQQGIEEVAEEALEKILKEGLEEVGKHGLKQLGGAMAKNAGAEMTMDAGVQGLHMAKGDRESWDFGKTGEALADGAPAMSSATVAASPATRRAACSGTGPRARLVPRPEVRRRARSAPWAGRR